MTDALTLSDVLARGTTIEWYEAVGVVRAVIEALVRAGENRLLIPDLHQIEIGTDGGIHLRGGAPAQEPVRRLGQLLQASLGESEPPVQLRLLLSQATAPIPAYATVREYDEALSYFDRPDRSAALRHLYSRAAQAPVVARVERTPTVDAIAPLPVPDPTNSSRPKPSADTRRTARLVGVCVTTAIMSVAAVLYAKRAGSPRVSAPNLVASVAHGLDVAGDRLMRGLSFATEQVGLGRLVSAETPAGTAPVQAPTAPKRTPRTTPTRNINAPHTDVTDGAVSRGTASAPPGGNGRARRALPATVVPFAAFDLEPANTRPSAPQRPIDETILVPVARANDSSVLNGPIFSSESEGISPPMALRPQLPRELPPDVRRSDLRRIEMIVSPAGTVESVKLVGWPRNVHDSMLLSAVKAWEFVPALKDGTAVRYRKTIWIARQ
jgi:hypothetical protein